jgi:hydroxyacylglutathione hydrolase
MGTIMANYICMPVGRMGVNCYIVYDDDRQAVVVDPGSDSERIINAIKKYNFKVIYVMLTHVHFDHILAAGDVIAGTGAKFLVPKDDEAALYDPDRSLMYFAGQNTELNIKPDRLLSDEDTVKAGKLEIRVVHTPGHTPGSSCYICGNLLISGDTLFAGSIGRTDFPGGDSAAIMCSLNRLSELEGDYTVLPGHGPSTTLAEEKRGNPYMNSSGYGFDY